MLKTYAIFGVIFAWLFFIISRQNYGYFTKRYYNIDRPFCQINRGQTCGKLTKNHP